MSDPRNEATGSSKKSRPPVWETFVLAGSFVALWAWYLLRQSALRADQTPSPLGSLLLAVALPLLVWVFARRMQRTLKALNGLHPSKGGRPERN